jgi:GLPGLI family protein
MANLSLYIMKHLLYLLLLILPNICFTQNIKAVYSKTTLKYLGDEADAKVTSKPTLHSYSYSNQKSIYKNLEEIKAHTDTIPMEHKGYQYNFTHKYTPFTIDTHYKDLKNNIYRREVTQNDVNTSIKDTLKDFKWVLLNETKVIKGYTCKKAVGYLNEYPVTAWFCEDIPVNDGPFFYSGLPGLIIEVQLSTSYKISLETLKIVNENIDIAEPVNKVPLTKNQ